MKKNRMRTTVLSLITIFLLAGGCQQHQADHLDRDFQSPPQKAKPWVFWYWLEGAVSWEGVHADLMAMKNEGIGGAYLMPIRGKTNPPWIEKPVIQLSPAWWKMVLYAMDQADSLGLQLSMHVGDGFAVAGGPWITPELSMQKVVWSSVEVKGESKFHALLPQPQTNEGYYRDIAVFAYPTGNGETTSTQTVHPMVTTSVAGINAGFLIKKDNRKNLISQKPCWIQYAFKQPFTCRSVTIRTAGSKFVGGSSYQSQRLLIKVSDDGKNFRSVGRLQPPRCGWQDWDEDVTHEIVPVTARYFRFVYDPEGSEPGAEDLDAAKWKQELKISNIELFSEARMNQFEGKNGSVWRISQRTTREEVPDSCCVPMSKMIDLTKYLNADGTLNWQVPPGKWTILRMGHTSTGHKNETGGGGKGLECDKFNPKAVKLQFENWYGEILKKAGPDLAAKVLRIFHVDSWECGSQNWSPVFAEEFKKRRGYSMLPYLPVLAGVPVQNTDVSERFLHDVRQTIAELVVDNFYKTLADLLKPYHIDFSAESVAPTMVSDGMLHFREVDIPMGEFWLRSPTHDKLNDILDAVSGGHIYGKPLIQSEAFTELRIVWDEDPALLKPLEDRNYAFGINRFVYHVFMENPWTDRRPGMTLNGVGLLCQRDQTWWKPGKAWVTYTQRCQALLQKGNPVVDVAVFTGEEVPCRSVLPDRLVPFLPGIFGRKVVDREKERLENKGTPIVEFPAGVFHSANMADPEDWTDPLHGYAYDSFNRDALLRLAMVNNGCIELPGGASYRLLIIPGSRKMMPNGDEMSPEVAARLLKLVQEGATILVNERPKFSPGLQNYPANDDSLRTAVAQLWNGHPTELTDGKGNHCRIWQVGKGRVVQGPFALHSFRQLGIEKDVMAIDSTAKQPVGIAWTHRVEGDADIYFISNQQKKQRTLGLSLRVDGKLPEFFDPLTGEIRQAKEWQMKGGRTIIPLQFMPNGSLFIVLRHRTSKNESHTGKNWLKTKPIMSLTGTWNVQFDEKSGGPKDPVAFYSLQDWTESEDAGVRYYSGTAVYTKTFSWQKNVSSANQRFWLDLGKVSNLAEITVNGISCGVAWTSPYRVELTKALKDGKNEMSIAVTNTWHNRLIGDHDLPEKERITWTNAPYRLTGKPLLKAGLFGPVQIVEEDGAAD